VIRTRVLAAASLAVLTLTLSGCVRMGVEVDLKADDAATSSVVLAVEDKYLDQTGQSPDSVIDALTQGQDDPAQDAVRTENFQQDGYTGTRYVYPDVAISDVGAQVGWPIKVVRKGGDYLVSGTLDLTEEGLKSRGGASIENLSVTVDITFPGKVRRSNGTIDGNTVRWEPTVGEAVEIRARGSASGPADQLADEVLVLGLSGLVILLLIGIIVWQAMMRVRDRRPEPADVPQFPQPHVSRQQLPQQQAAAPVVHPATQPYGAAPAPYGAGAAHPQEQATPPDPSRPPSFPPGF
jgi:hypothetical protein